MPLTLPEAAHTAQPGLSPASPAASPLLSSPLRAPSAQGRTAEFGSAPRSRSPVRRSPPPPVPRPLPSPSPRSLAFPFSPLALHFVFFPFSPSARRLRSPLPSSAARPCGRSSPPPRWGFTPHLSFSPQFLPRTSLASACGEEARESSLQPLFILPLSVSLSLSLSLSQLGYDSRRTEDKMRNCNINPYAHLSISSPRCIIQILSFNLPFSEEMRIGAAQTYPTHSLAQPSSSCGWPPLCAILAAALPWACTRCLVPA